MRNSRVLKYLNQPLRTLSYNSVFCCCSVSTDASSCCIVPWNLSVWCWDAVRLCTIIVRASGYQTQEQILERHDSTDILQLSAAFFQLCDLCLRGQPRVSVHCTLLLILILLNLIKNCSLSTPTFGCVQTALLGSKKRTIDG